MLLLNYPRATIKTSVVALSTHDIRIFQVSTNAFYSFMILLHRNRPLFLTECGNIEHILTDFGNRNTGGHGNFFSTDIEWIF